MTYPAIIVDENGDQTAGNTIEFTDPDNQPAPSGPGGGTAPFEPATAGATVVIAQNTSDQDVLDFDETGNAVNIGAGTGSTRINLIVNGNLTGRSYTASGGITAGDNVNFGNHRLTVGSIVSNGNLGFFGTAAVGVQTVNGALSTVLDAAAKDVLTSIIASLVAYGLAVDGTT